MVFSKQKYKWNIDLPDNVGREKGKPASRWFPLLCCLAPFVASCHGSKSVSWPQWRRYRRTFLEATCIPRLLSPHCPAKEKVSPAGLCPPHSRGEEYAAHSPTVKTIRKPS